MRWIAIVMLCVAGCAVPEVEDPDGEPKYQVGDIVYHIIDDQGRKMVVISNESSYTQQNDYKVSYFNDVGEIMYANLREDNLTDERPKED